MTLAELESKAIRILKMFEPPEGYYLGYSGGKDSDVILALAKVAGVKFDSHHNHTTLDFPETVYHVRSKKREKENNLTIDYPSKSFWQLVVQKGSLPLRTQRFCCTELKEKGGKGRLCILGVRSQESTSRALNNDFIKIRGGEKIKRIAEENDVLFRPTPKGGIVLNVDNGAHRLVEQCYRTHKTQLNIILDWSDDQVWEYIKYYGIEYNPLYDEGFDRVGCVCCPMASKCQRHREINKYPRFKIAFLKTIDRMLLSRRERGKRPVPQWGGQNASAESVFDWWMNITDLDKNQLSFFEEEMED